MTSKKTYFSFSEGDSLRLARMMMMLQGAVNGMLAVMWLVVLGVLFPNTFRQDGSSNVLLVFGAVAALWIMIAIVGSKLRGRNTLMLGIVLQAIAVSVGVVTFISTAELVGVLNILLSLVVVTMMVSALTEKKEVSEPSSEETKV